MQGRARGSPWCGWLGFDAIFMEDHVVSVSFAAKRATMIRFTCESLQHLHLLLCHPLELWEQSRNKLGGYT